MNRGSEGDPVDKERDLENGGPRGIGHCFMYNEVSPVTPNMTLCIWILKVYRAHSIFNFWVYGP